MQMLHFVHFDHYGRMGGIRVQGRWKGPVAGFRDATESATPGDLERV